MMPNDNLPPTPHDSSTTAQVAHVAIKLPPFWKTNPALWFVRLEAQFALANITSDATKFNHVIAAIDSDVLNSVSDILMKPPNVDKYDALKTRLTDLHSESEASKIRTLLQGLELGDQRPSQLLTRMRTLADQSVGDALLKSLWLGRLPQSMQTILAVLNDDLDQLAKVADKVHDVTPHPYVNVIKEVPEPSTSRLEQQISQLTKQVAELQAVVDRRNSRGGRRNFRRSNSRSKSRDRYKQYKEPTNDLCFYHTNFGADAKKCKPPCSARRQENWIGDRPLAMEATASLIVYFWPTQSQI